MTIWKSLHDDQPPVGCKFIALYSDGSGATMFFRHDGGFIDCEGDDYGAMSDSYDLWTELPQDKEFYCEIRSPDPMTLLPTPQETASE